MKKALMYGAGNIGRGFIGQLFSQSGYEVVFIDVNKELLDKLNTDGRYPVRVLTGKEAKDIIVENVRAVDGTNIQLVAEEISDAEVMATAVGVNILPRIAKPLAEGLRKRWAKGNHKPFNILICENLLDANHVLAGLIKQELEDNEMMLFDKLVGLVEASIGRMVPVMTPEMQEGNIARVCVEEYGELPVDKDGFKGEVPYIVNLHPFSPFSFYIHRKLFIHNMGHALTAYLGRLSGYEYIWQAIGDPVIKLAVMQAMQDSARALSREHGVELDQVLEHVEDLLYRFGNKQLGDTVSRVGNDTKRKLSHNDRMIGAVNLAVSKGINPANICLGIAAAMIFKMDDADSGIFGMIQESSPADVLEKHSGISKESSLSALVLKLYAMLSKGMELKDILSNIAGIKREKL